MSRERHYIKCIDDIRVDFRFIIERGKILHFCINVTLEENEKTTDVYRVDTAHGYLHEQRFWISPKPKKLEIEDYNHAFDLKLEEVLINCERWVKLFKENVRK